MCGPCFEANPFTGYELCGCYLSLLLDTHWTSANNAVSGGSENGGGGGGRHGDHEKEELVPLGDLYHCGVKPNQ